MEYSAPATLTTPGPDITFNAASGDTYRLDPERCSGLDQASLRTVVDKRSQTAGGILHANLRDVRRITLGGLFISDTVAGRNTLDANLKAALEAIELADGTFSITPTGLTVMSWTVHCELALSTTGALLKGFLFGLLAVNPNSS